MVHVRRFTWTNEGDCCLLNTAQNQLGALSIRGVQLFTTGGSAGNYAQARQTICVQVLEVWDAAGCNERAQLDKEKLDNLWAWSRKNVKPRVRKDSWKPTQHPEWEQMRKLHTKFDWNEGSTDW